ncbi:MAG: hypothetical protein EOP06_00195 [Proteobacteria bacterium]|nr:MAG: hypothetical protein EOP06_00195 [Pseudomonadota bacterium]
MGILKIGPYEVRVDDEDFETLNSMSWTFCMKKILVFQSRLDESGLRKRTTLQRVIMRPAGSEIVVQKPGFNQFDFRKEAWKCVSRSAHQAKLGKQRTSGSSAFKGVSLSAQSGKWRATISYSGKSYFLGQFASESEAALAYNRAAQQYFGDEAFLNDVDSSAASLI